VLVTLSFKPAMIDPSRMGGANAPHRHAFAGPIAAYPPPAPRQATTEISAPPPRRMILSQASGVNETKLAAIRGQVDAAVETLLVELEVVKAELDFVLVQTLRDNPTAYTRIPIIGLDFTPQEIRTQIAVDARQIETLAARLRNGTTASYLTPKQIETLNAVAQDAKDLVAYVQTLDVEPIAAAHARLSEEHLESHVKGVRDTLRLIEESIVSAEGAGVPVQEPVEKKRAALGTFIGIGAIVVLGLIAFDII
jgi:hypothetical protein